MLFRNGESLMKVFENTSCHKTSYRHKTIAKTPGYICLLSKDTVIDYWSNRIYMVMSGPIYIFFQRGSLDFN